MQKQFPQCRRRPDAGGHRRRLCKSVTTIFYPTSMMMCEPSDVSIQQICSGSQQQYSHSHAASCSCSACHASTSKYRCHTLWYTCCLLPIFILFFAVTSVAQSATATADRDKILIGEQITIELKVRDINTRMAPLTAWFSLPDTVNHIEVVKRSPIDTITLNGITTYTQNITVTSFDSGSMGSASAKANAAKFRR